MGDLRSELLAIREQQGQLTPLAVVQTASAPDHPLHHRFEWDDSVAGHKYRLQQAHALIRVVKERFIASDGEPAETRFFHAVPRTDAASMAYVPAAEVASDEFATKVLLASMEREWRQLRKRYERFAQFRELVLRDLQPPEEEVA